MSRRLPNFLRQSEADALLATAQVQLAAARSPAKRRAARLDLLLLQAGLFLGLRVSELCNLRIPDVDLMQNTVLVNQGKGDKDRYVPIPASFLPEFNGWMRGEGRGTGDSFVFPSPRGGRLAPRTVELRMAALGEKAQIPRRLKPHTLRHTFATRLLERGANIREVQELMGHSSVATTELYTHVVPERLRAAVDRL